MVAKLNMTLDIEYDAATVSAASMSAVRIEGKIRDLIAQPTERGMPTGINPDSVKVTVTKKTIDGKPVTVLHGR